VLKPGHHKAATPRRRRARSQPGPHAQGGWGTGSSLAAPHTRAGLRACSTGLLFGGGAAWYAHPLPTVFGWGRPQVAALVDAVVLLRCLLRALPALSESLAWVESPLLQAVRGWGFIPWFEGSSTVPVLSAASPLCCWSAALTSNPLLLVQAASQALHQAAVTYTAAPADMQRNRNRSGQTL
jgi:hypothetical protein